MGLNLNSGSDSMDQMLLDHKEAIEKLKSEHFDAYNKKVNEHANEIREHK